MKRILFLLFTIAFANAQAKKLPDLRGLFLSLPDSVFTIGSKCFSEKDSFPRTERLQLLNRFDSSLTSFDAESGIRFWITEANDTIQRISFTKGEQRVSLTIHSRSKKEIFFSIRSEECDFVACFQRWRFFTLRNGKLKEEFNVLPGGITAEMFFDKTYLAQMDVEPLMLMDGVEIILTEDPTVLQLVINTEFFDPELFGADQPMTKLDPEKMTRQEYQLKLKGKVFEVVVP